MHSSRKLGSLSQRDSGFTNAGLSWGESDVAIPLPDCPWRTAQMRYCLTFSLAVLLAATFVVVVIYRDSGGSDPGEPPVATSLPIGSLGWATTRSPTVAVSESGVIYVIWSGKGQQKAPQPATVPMIPDELSFSVHQPEWSAVPGVNVYRKGNWSEAGLLVEGPKDCAPLWSWCEGEKLHLLVVSESANKCNHLVLDPTANRWTRQAELPFAPSQYSSWRQCGQEVHLACVDGEHVHYLRYDGKSWNKPVKIEHSENKTSGVTRVRMAVDRQGGAHVAWWTAHPEPGIHGYAVIREGQVNAEPLKFDQAAIHEDNFDLGIDLEGRLLLAYKADLPKDDRESLKVHIRRRDGKGWTNPETIGGEGEVLFGDIVVVWCEGRTLVSWLSREKYSTGGFVTVKAVRRFSVHDGKSWTSSRRCAWESGLVGGHDLMGAIRPGVCIDKDGRVHLAWGSSHCVVTQLKR